MVSSVSTHFFLGGAFGASASASVRSMRFRSERSMRRKPNEGGPRIAKSSSSLVPSSSEGSSSGSSFNVRRSRRHLHTSFSASSVQALSVA